MNFSPAVIAYLVFTLLIGQLSAVLHGVGHLHLSQTPAAHQWKVAGYGKNTDFGHTHKASLRTRDAHSETALRPHIDADHPDPDAENENCLIYHIHACQYAQVAANITLAAIRFHSVVTPNWRATVTRSTHATGHLIRGPPARS